MRDEGTHIYRSVIVFTPSIDWLLNLSLPHAHITAETTERAQSLV